LEKRKIYEVIPDSDLPDEQLRVIDESGEDFIYPSEYFVEVHLPEAIQQAIKAA